MNSRKVAGPHLSATNDVARFLRSRGGTPAGLPPGQRRYSLALGSFDGIGSASCFRVA